MNTFFVSVVLLIVCVVSVSSLTCFYCANCPVPFSSYGVPTVTSYTGFCLKQSTSSIPGAVASRGSAPPGLCNYSGCEWSRSTGFYTCCCQTSYCNTGNLTSKSTISILLSTLILFIIQKLF